MNLEHFWTIRHIRNNKVIWETINEPNTIANQGISLILNSFYRGGPVPTNFYVRLANYSPQITDTLATISSYEPTGNGYTPQILPASLLGYPTSTTDANGSTTTITSNTVTFTASGGNIGPITLSYISTSADNSGKLISYLPLSITRTVLNGDSMEYFYTCQLN